MKFYPDIHVSHIIYPNVFGHPFLNHGVDILLPWTLPSDWIVITLLSPDCSFSTTSQNLYLLYEQYFCLWLNICITAGLILYMLNISMFTLSFSRIHLGRDQTNVGWWFPRLYPWLVEPDGLCHELSILGHHFTQDCGLRQGNLLSLNRSRIDPCSVTFLCSHFICSPSIVLFSTVVVNPGTSGRCGIQHL